MSASPAPILVALDSRASCREALLAGVQLAKARSAPLRLVHALGLPRTTDVDSASAVAMAAQLGAWLGARRAALLAQFGSVLSEHGVDMDEVLDVRAGSVAREVCHLASELGAQVLVLGPHERDAPFDLGSTARAVLGAAPCDVWFQGVPWRDVSRILVPIDLSDHSLAALKVATALAGSLGASLRVLHAWYPDELYAGVLEDHGAGSLPLDSYRQAASQALDRELAEFDFGGIEWDSTFVDARSVKAILDAQEGCDLIAMGSHGRTGLVGALMGNTAYSVLCKAERPVLAIRHPEHGDANS